MEDILLPPSYKSAVVQVLLQTLFKKEHLFFRESLDRLISNNNQLHSHNYHGIYLGKEVFVYSHLPPGSGIFYGTIHTVLKDHSKELYSQLKEYRATRLPVKQYLVYVMNIAKTFADVYHVIPQNLHKFLPDAVKRNAKYSSSSLSDEDIQQLSVQYKDLIQYINEQLLIQLIEG